MKEKGSNLTLPLLALRGVVVFPNGIINIEVARPKSIAAILHAEEIKTNKKQAMKIFLVTQKNIADFTPKQEDLFEIGTVCTIKHFIKISDGVFKLTAVGDFKAKIVKFCSNDDNKNFYKAEVVRVPERTSIKTSEKLQVLIRSIKKQFMQYCSTVKSVNKELNFLIEGEQNPLKLFTILAEITPLKFNLKQQLLEESSLTKKLHLLLEFLVQELDIAILERKMMEKIESRIDRNQRDYFLREQAKVIKEELGEDDIGSNDCAIYMEKILKIKNISEESKKKLVNEARQLERMPELSHEACVVTNYLDKVLKLPWDISTKEKINLKVATATLNKNHYGLKKIKERILENLAVRSFNPKINGQILCLVGPPGVGKSSIAKSIASAIGRKFVRISLGGISDETDITGHKKTYIGAMPGRIIEGLIRAGARNPLILLDEIDKIGTSYKGDPSAALLEVLDSEQNNEFFDNYINLPFDLSKCFFVATANSVSTISSPLLNRMELIELSSYTIEEKFHIVKSHLWPKQVKNHGLSNEKIIISDDAIYEIIEGYTKEAGVRKLERVLASLLRKAAKQLLSNKTNEIKFKKSNLTEFLGARKYLSETISKTDEIGLVNGLAWTSVGGELMQIEAGIMDGKGKIQLTGNLGDVMKESASTAISFVRSVAEKYHISSDFHKNKDIHIHIPEGAVPKDGPSAGVALAVAVVSALSKKPIRHDIAMTGEISLRGRDLAIGGLKEKAIAAYKSGVRTVLIPQDNLQDLDEIDDIVKNAVKFIPCKTADQVLEYALIDNDNKSKKQEAN